MGILVNKLPTLKEVIALLIKEERISYDTETTGLFPFHGDRPFSYIFSTAKEDFYIDLDKGGIPKSMAIPEIAKIFTDADRQFLGMNIIFDLCMGYVDGINLIRGRFIDAPSLARVEYNQHEGTGIRSDGQSFLSMDYLGDWYLDERKDDAVKNYIKEHNLYKTCHVTGEKDPDYLAVSRLNRPLMVNYGFRDGRLSFDTTVQIIKKINQKDIDYSPYRPQKYGKMIDVAKNEIQLTSTLFEVKKRGFPIDREYINMAIEHEKKERELAIKDIEKELGKDFQYTAAAQIVTALKTRGFPIEYNTPTASMEKRALKYINEIDNLSKELDSPEIKERRKLTVLKKRNDLIEKKNKLIRGNPKTDKKTLARYSSKYDLPWLNSITKAKQSDKKITTYYENFLMLADPNDVIHCGLNQETAVTGRTSSTEPNLQNLHKESWKDEAGNIINEWLVRNSFISFPNGRLLFADYSQQEMYVMLDQAQEMAVIDKLLSGEFEDFYLATAAVVYEKSGRKITRQQAKAIALGLAYGQGKALLAKNLGVTESEAEEIIKAFFSALPKLLKFKNDLQAYAKRFGRIHNPFGRVYYVDKGYEYKALNAYVQGTSADIAKTAMINCELGLENHKTKLINMVHDELIFFLHNDDNEKEICKIIENAMIKAYPHIHIPLGVDFEISNINSRGVSPWGEKEHFYV